MANQERKLLKMKGRATHNDFLGIPKYVCKSPEFGQLGAWPLKLLVEIARHYNGNNNGNLSCSYTQLKDRGFNSSSTLDKAKKHLLDNGWIITTRTGNRARCSLYAVTWWAIHECPGSFLEVRPGPVSNRWQKSKNAVAMRTDVVAMRTGEA